MDAIIHSGCGCLRHAARPHHAEILSSRREDRRDSRRGSKCERLHAARMSAMESGMFERYYVRCGDVQDSSQYLTSEGRFRAVCANYCGDRIMFRTFGLCQYGGFRQSELSSSASRAGRDTLNEAIRYVLSAV